MRKDVGLVLVIQSRKVPGYGKRKPSKKKSEPRVTLAQLEKYFCEKFNPSASSRVAAAMRELLKENPELSFDELRLLAIEKIRSKVTRTV
jgi:hypothetical protein